MLIKLKNKKVKRIQNQPLFFKINPKQQRIFESYCLRKGITAEKQIKKMMDYVIQDETNWQVGKECKSQDEYNIKTLCPKCKKKRNKRLKKL